MRNLHPERQAYALCESLNKGVHSSGLSTVTTAIYDTAWLSMILKKTEGTVSWVFPLCFQYILDQQCANGGWGASSTPEDEILSSLAALLALKRHQSGPAPNGGLKMNIDKGIFFLESALQEYRMSDNLAVGFEYLFPALLKLLGSEGIDFSFPAEKAILRLRETKLKKFSPDLLYGTEDTTLLHSLEAFTDVVDFDKLRHRKSFGSMMASPASTAVYLMNTANWDEEAEDYLRRVIRDGPGKGNGAVPSVYPTPLFEVSWV